MAAPLVLVAEDDPSQAEVVRRYLVAEGYAVVTVHDGAEALEQTWVRRPDLVVLDVMMPGLDGLEVCRRLRARSDGLAETPILMLTARATEDDLLVGLGVGADDYVTKPYSPRELTARIGSLMRRTSTRAVGEDEEPVHRVGRLIVETARRRVLLGGVEVRCTPVERALLTAMAAQPGRAFTRLQLLRLADGLDRGATERAVDVHVVNLRRKLEVDPRHPRMLRTVRGVGYQLVSDEG